jgi:hypothetical protein
LYLLAFQVAPWRGFSVCPVGRQRGAYRKAAQQGSCWLAGGRLFSAAAAAAGAWQEFVFKVSLRAVVRVRAADESVARNVVPTVLGAPGSTEIALANQNNMLVGRDATVTGVEFSMVGPIKSSK